MFSRRAFLGASAALSVLPSASFAGAAGYNPCDDVDPFVGTGGHGHTFPGATLPFGMVQLSPDTSNQGWDSCSGYHQKDGSIMGFSHTHLSGTGCADLLDLLVVPRTGKILLDPGTIDAPETGYRSRYDRKSEYATPGYYRVHLTDSRVLAELTATLRAGLHRYTFPAGEEGHLLIDWSHSNLNWWQKPVKPIIDNASLRVIGNDTLVGRRQVSQWAKGRWIYFALKVSRPFRMATLYTGNAPVHGSAVEGRYLKCVLKFPDAGKAPLLVRAGISGVDIDGALKNLEAELPDYNFERVRKNARAAWSKALSAVNADSADTDIRKVFYTAQYHMMLAPNTYSDVDGRYRGMDGAVHQLGAGEVNYTTFSLWDTFRASHPFFILTDNPRVPDMMRSLIRMGQESPSGPPIWPLQGCETDMMIGYHSSAVLAEACRKGVKGVDYHAAYQIMRNRAFYDTVHGLGWYRKQGYLPADRENESVSRTLDYAYDDWALSHLAAAAGKPKEAEFLRKRSRNYQNLFDRKTGFMRGRLSDGTWATPFTPDSLGHDQQIWRDFTECNSWEATFLNQHDLYGYIKLFGGDTPFETKLDGLFTASSAMTDGDLSDISGLIGQYAQGDEPCHHVAYLYAYAGAAHKTQAQVRQIMTTLYRTGTEGLCGNDDCGQMSAWYAMSALGFYPVDPVSAVYVMGAPLLDKAEISVGGGKTFTVEAPDNKTDAPYVQSATLNGRPLNRAWLHHDEIMRGGRLVVKMGRTPHPEFGCSNRPPSFA